MKKLLVLSAVLLGTVAASQAGVSVHIGIPLPPLPHIVIGHPAPPVVVAQPPVVYTPAPVCAPAPVVVAPPPVCVQPRVVYAPPVAVVRPMPPGYYKHWLHRNERWHH